MGLEVCLCWGGWGQYMLRIFCEAHAVALYVASALRLGVLQAVSCRSSFAVAPGQAPPHRPGDLSAAGARGAAEIHRPTFTCLFLCGFSAVGVLGCGPPPPPPPACCLRISVKRLSSFSLCCAQHGHRVQRPLPFLAALDASYRTPQHFID